MRLGVMAVKAETEAVRKAAAVKNLIFQTLIVELLQTMEQLTNESGCCNRCLSKCSPVSFGSDVFLGCEESAPHGHIKKILRPLVYKSIGNRTKKKQERDSSLHFFVARCNAYVICLRKFLRTITY